MFKRVPGKKPQGKKDFRDAAVRWEENITMDVEKTGSEDVNRVRSSGRLL